MIFVSKGNYNCFFRGNCIDIFFDQFWCQILNLKTFDNFFLISCSFKFLPCYFIGILSTPITYAKAKYTQCSPSVPRPKVQKTKPFFAKKSQNQSRKTSVIVFTFELPVNQCWPICPPGPLDWHRLASYSKENLITDVFLD